MYYKHLLLKMKKEEGAKETCKSFCLLLAAVGCRGSILDLTTLFHR